MNNDPIESYEDYLWDTPKSRNDRIKSEQLHWKIQGWARDLLQENDKCIVCGSKENLVPHHVAKIDRYNSFYIDPANGVVMCEKCHKKYHNEYSEVSAKTLIKFVKRCLKNEMREM